MTSMGQVNINLFAASILAIILINENLRRNCHNKQDRLFLRIVYPNIILCLSDAIAWSRENTSGDVNVIINHIFTSLAFMAIPFLLFGWFLYALYNIYRNDDLLRRFEKAMLPLYVIFCGIVLINPFSKWLFYLDESNCYHRGFLYYPFTIFPYVILVISLIMVIMNKKRIQRGHFLPLTFFIIPTLVTSLLAIMFYGSAVAWVGTTIAIFIIYLFIQSQRMGTDYLTTLYNRRQLDEYLQNRMKGRRADENFGIAMFDINQFKYINDTWGHKAGDEVLVDLSGIMRSVFRSREFLSRYGGDEFVIILDVHTKEEITAALKRFIKAIEHFNETSGRPWKISISIGYDLHVPSESNMNTEYLLHHIDKLMYQAKLANCGMSVATHLEATIS